MTTQRTPGPWHSIKHGTPAYAPQYGVYAGDRNDFCIVKGDNAESDAAFIVLACNAHDRLTAENAKLREALHRIHTFAVANCTAKGDPLDRIVERCERALADKGE